MRVGAMTHVGQIRKVNEDGFLAQSPVLAVADGMGGHRAGEVASSLALKVVAGWPFDFQHPEDSLHQAVDQANAKILSYSGENAELAGMGTTLSIALIIENWAYIAHIGDSRIYKYDGQDLCQLTQDHSVVAELVRSGALTEEEALVHPHRNVLTRALGAGPEIVYDERKEHLHVGDVLVLCTDGLYSLVTDEELRQVLMDEADPQKAAEQLVALANARGGHDNITALVAVIES